MDKEATLKHCPFCGKGKSQVELYEVDILQKPPLWRISCGACGSSSGISKDKEMVVKKWNSRPEEGK